MLFLPDKLRQLYDQILRNGIVNHGPAQVTQIFVSNEVDSICSLRILLTLLKSDELQYVVTPVFSNTHLIEELNRLQEISQDQIQKSNENRQSKSIINTSNLQSNKSFLRTIIFLNCGGQIDQTKMWYYMEEAKLQLFIFDSHRPFHHNNLIDTARKIHIVHDGCTSLDNSVSQQELTLLQESTDIDEDEEDEDFEDDDLEIQSDIQEARDELNDLKDRNLDEEDEEEYDRSSQINDDQSDKDSKRLYNFDIQASEDIQNPEEQLKTQNNLDNIKVGQKRGRLQQQKIVDFKMQRRLTRIKFRKYYSGTFFWKCSAQMMYQLCQSLNRESRDFLWLWITGMYDHIINQVLSLFQYEEDVQKCNNEVQRLNPQIYNREELLSESIRESQSSRQEGNQLPKVVDLRPDLFKLVSNSNQNQEVGSIVIDSELKLMLLKHWTFWDSLNNSNYLVSQLNLWNQQGKIYQTDFWYLSESRKRRQSKNINICHQYSRIHSKTRYQKFLMGLV
eukprot:403343083